MEKLFDEPNKDVSDSSTGTEDDHDDSHSSDNEDDGRHSDDSGGDNSNSGSNDNCNFFQFKCPKKDCKLNICMYAYLLYIMCTNMQALCHQQIASSLLIMK